MAARIPTAEAIMNTTDATADSSPTDEVNDPKAINTTASSEATTTADSRLFRLPLELRDEIYDLLALEETRIFVEIGLQKGEKPRKEVFAVRGLGHTTALLRLEYTRAVERRVGGLMSKGDLNGDRICTPASMYKSLRKPRLDVSRTQRSDGSFDQHAHALTIQVPCKFPYWGWENPNSIFRTFAADVRQHLVVTFTLDSNEDLESRLSIAGPREIRTREQGYKFPRGCMAAMEEMASVAKSTKWTGLLRYLQLWQAYVLCWMRKDYFQEEKSEELSDQMDRLVMVVRDNDSRKPDSGISFDIDS